MTQDTFVLPNRMISILPLFNSSFYSTGIEFIAEHRCRPPIFPVHNLHPSSGQYFHQPPPPLHRRRPVDTPAQRPPRSEHSHPVATKIKERPTAESNVLLQPRPRPEPSRPRRQRPHPSPPWRPFRQLYRRRPGVAHLARHVVRQHLGDERQHLWRGLQPAPWWLLPPAGSVVAG